MAQANGLYRVSIKRSRGPPHIFGWYATSTEAAVAYDELALRIIGADTVTNFEQVPGRLPLYSAPLPATWKGDDHAWKARPETWYEALMTERLLARGVLDPAAIVQKDCCRKRPAKHKARHEDATGAAPPETPTTNGDASVSSPLYSEASRLRTPTKGRERYLPP